MSNLIRIRSETDMIGLKKEEGMNGTPDQFISEETVEYENKREFGVNASKLVITRQIMSSN